MSRVEIEKVLGSELSNKGTVQLQIGDPVTGIAVDDAVQHMSGFGIVSMPCPPNEGKGGAEVVVLKTSGADIAIAGRDARFASIVGNMEEGETCVYAPGSMAYAVFKNDGGVSIGTTSTNNPDGYSNFFQVRPTGFAWHCQWGTMRFDATGFHINHRSGARLDLGAIGGLPAPLDQLSSYATMSAATVTLDGTAVHVGGASTPIADTAAKSTPLMLYLAALNAAVAAVAAVASAATPTAASAAALETMATALETLASAVSTNTPLIPSSTGVS